MRVSCVSGTISYTLMKAVVHNDVINSHICLTKGTSSSTPLLQSYLSAIHTLSQAVHQVFRVGHRNTAIVYEQRGELFTVVLCLLLGMCIIFSSAHINLH